MLLQDDIGIHISIKQQSRCWVHWLDICRIRIGAGIIIRTSTQIRAAQDQYKPTVTLTRQHRWNSTSLAFRNFPFCLKAG